MRFQSIFGILALVAGALVSVNASPLGDPAEPEVVVHAAFPEENVFGQVVNGERNKMLLLIENNSEHNITLLNAGGSIHHAESGALVKNVSQLTYGLPLLEGAKIQLPFTFYSECQPGDHRLKLWLQHAAEGTVYQVDAYDGIITVVEPEVSWFDIKLILTYIFTTAILGGLGYVAYVSFVPQTKKARKPKTSAVSEPVAVTATGAGGYQEEWIPEHHLKKPKATKRTKSGNVTSGDELSGAESGAEKKRSTRRK
ncbi:hypothetical protein PUNSTDRAFT_93696 [Punctularia strigosozonata HHB-11173 SS5]|uniref:Signal sequence receptor subunit alpha n=1 Tax=Punctularia strigosozonata (strain HHB-11173) TaxID=741275 RepID=R7S002_PUNST|nr:uncharacterized protein PUNSTDRAFT_93696 [Punctularia strigosozonata HHB-11173 SS5]EIN03695.1 hypothetical protein PUNSTDRAFT_93696 [Punctularia strigosozonata HHB-11173 SS5]